MKKPKDPLTEAQRLETVLCFQIARRLQFELSAWNLKNIRKRFELITVHVGLFGRHDYKRAVKQVKMQYRGFGTNERNEAANELPPKVYEKCAKQVYKEVAELAYKNYLQDIKDINAELIITPNMVCINQHP